MKKFTVMAAVLAMSAAFTVTPASAADACKSACNASYTTCTKAKDAQACLPSWGQCKAKCKRSDGSVSAKNTAPAKPVKTAQR